VVVLAIIARQRGSMYFACWLYVAADCYGRKGGVGLSIYIPSHIHGFFLDSWFRNVRKATLYFLQLAGKSTKLRGDGGDINRVSDFILTSLVKPCDSTRMKDYCFKLLFLSEEGFGLFQALF
jgi:hypothetical protein